MTNMKELEHIIEPIIVRLLKELAEIDDAISRVSYQAIICSFPVDHELTVQLHKAWDKVKDMVEQYTDMLPCEKDDIK